MANSFRFDVDTQIYAIANGEFAPLVEGLKIDPGEQIVAVCFSPDNRLAATASRENKIRWWKRTTGPEGEKLEPTGRAPKDLDSEARVNSLTFGPKDGELMAMAWNQPPRIIPTDNDTVERPILRGSTQDTFVRYAFSPIIGGRQLGTVATFGRVLLAPAAEIERAEQHSEPICFPGASSVPRFSEDGKRLLILSGATWNAMDTLQVWDVHDLWTRPAVEASKDIKQIAIQDPAPRWLSELAEVIGGGWEYGPDEFPTFSGMIGKPPATELDNPYRRIWQRFFVEGLPANPVPR
jgi:WD40 repeat protein